MTTPNQTTLHIFSKATLSAIRLALSPSEPAKIRRQAEYAAYANARAAARAAKLFLEPR